MSENKKKTETIIVRTSPEIAAKLDEVAAERGVKKSVLVREALENVLEPPPREKARREPELAAA